MDLRKLISPDRAQALSTPAVISMALCLAIGCITLIWIVFSTLLDAGHILAPVLVMLPLAKGLSHYCEVTLCYCRPSWFKQAPAIAGDEESHSDVD